MTRACTTLRRAVLAAAATAILWPAIADAATTIGNVYYDLTGTTCGNAVTSCEMLFAAVPASKILVVHRVTCRVTAPSTARIDYLQLRRRSGNSATGLHYLAPLNVVSTLNGRTHYLVNADVMLALSGGDRPSIYLALRATAANPSMACTVHGVIN
jgi:hypothetical protein